jgi:hypothetical protein
VAKKALISVFVELTDDDGEDRSLCSDLEVSTETYEWMPKLIRKTFEEALETALKHVKPT